MNKRIIAVLALTLLLTGCGSTDNDQSVIEKSSTVSSELSIASDSILESEECSSERNIPEPTENTTTVTKAQTTLSQPTPEVNAMKININGTEYTAHFSDTAAAEEFKAMLPLTLEMSELNGNEKYIYLDTSFTTASENVGYINKGEIMLYGLSCVVLFYDSFSTPYSYTRLGYIDDPSGLESAVGSGSVTVTFEGE